MNARLLHTASLRSSAVPYRIEAQELRASHPGGKSPHRKRSPANRDAAMPQISNHEDVLEPAAGGPAPITIPVNTGLLRKLLSRQEWEYLERLPPGSLAEEIKLLRVLSLRLVQQGLQAENPGDEIRYYSEATRIMARLPQLLRAEKALQSGQDDVTRAMILAINTVLEEVENQPTRAVKLPLFQGAENAEDG